MTIVVGLTSGPRGGQGKTTLCVSLATLLSLHSPTLLIDIGGGATSIVQVSFPSQVITPPYVHDFVKWSSDGANVLDFICERSLASLFGIVEESKKKRGFFRRKSKEDCVEKFKEKKLYLMPCPYGKPLKDVYLFVRKLPLLFPHFEIIIIDFPAMAHIETWRSLIESLDLQMIVTLPEVATLCDIMHGSILTENTVFVVNRFIPCDEHVSVLNLIREYSRNIFVVPEDPYLSVFPNYGLYALPRSSGKMKEVSLEDILKKKKCPSTAKALYDIAFFILSRR